MHRTLKRRAVKPVQRTCAAQQEQFDALRPEYNTERPHDALGGDTPGSRYAPSRRSYAERLPTPEYPGHFLVKRVTDAGTFRFQHRLLYIAKAVVSQHIRPGGDRRRRVGDLLQHRAPRDPRRARFRHSRVTPKVLSMSSDTCVTCLSGCSGARTRTVKGCHTA